MTLTQFIKKYKGTKVDFDGLYGCQCVDLYRQYCKDVLQTEQSPGVEGAKDIFDKPGKLTKIVEGPQADYSTGDILIWDATKTNPYGHVAILVAIYNTNNFVVLEQNGFDQKGTVLNLRTRENLLGGLWKRTDT